MGIREKHGILGSAERSLVLLRANSLLMDYLECANCGRGITEDGPCPNCGSTERMMMYDLLTQPEIRGNISMLFVAPIQIWTYLPAAIQSHLKTIAESRNDREIKGLCLESVNSTAAFVEGLVTDYIELELESLLNIEEKRPTIQPILDGMEFKNWRLKKDLIRNHLRWPMQDFDSFDMTNLLFKLRDQLGHGKSYKLADRRHFKEGKL